MLVDGSEVAVPDNRNVANGWGQWGSTHIVGPERKPVPQRLTLEWFSFTEDKFYQGSFALPEKTISAFFETGIPEDRQTRKPKAFERIIVGMAPGGLVSVWLSAGGEVIEVASFEATSANLPWLKVLDNPEMSRSTYINQVLDSKLSTEDIQRLKRDGVPVRLYAQYRNLYRWRPWVTGIGIASDIRIITFSGENSYIAPTGPVIPREVRPVPQSIAIKFSAPAGPMRQAAIQFDEDEIFSAFTKLSRGERDWQLALQIETSRSAVGVSLRDENFVLPLHKTRIEVTGA